MCGILSYYNKNGIKISTIKEFQNSLQSISHRGPDGEGIVLINTKEGVSKTLRTNDTPQNVLCQINDNSDIQENYFDLILGHRRLSIFDTSIAGHQPMSDGKGNWIIFNGEIYNFIEIREELRIKGYVFKTSTDTEVILSAYNEWREDCLNKFNGMWSFVLWDNNLKKIFIANDRFGVKPLYYYNETNEFIIASEIKQFLAFKNRVKSYNVDNFNVFLENGMLDFDDSTFLKGVKKFKASHFICTSIGSLQESELPFKQYYKLKINQQKIIEKDAIERFENIFSNAVEIRLRSDVPIGVTVSGGLDSSAIVYKVRELLKNKEPIKSFSAVFPGSEGDESEFIDFINDDLSLIKNTVNPLDEFKFDDFLDHIFHQDFPVQSTSFYAQWSVARLASEKGMKIILNGQGADEVFAGYHHHFYKYCKSLILSGKVIQYLKIAKSYAKLKGWAFQKVHTAVMADVKLAVKMKLHLGKMDNSLRGQWNNAKSLSEILEIDFSVNTIPTYLRSDDRGSMAFGLESRHPFMDYRLVEYGFNLPDNLKIKGGWQKWIIRQSVDYVPDKIRWRKDKKGYTTPQELWIKRYQDEFEQELGRLREFGIEPKQSFREYSLSLWLKRNKLS